MEATRVPTQFLIPEAPFMTAADVEGWQRSRHHAGPPPSCSAILDRFPLTESQVDGNLIPEHAVGIYDESDILQPFELDLKGQVSPVGRYRLRGEEFVEWPTDAPGERFITRDSGTYRVVQVDEHQMDAAAQISRRT